MECTLFFRIGLLALIVAIAAPAASAATVQLTGPTVISSPGTYVLAQDIAASQSPAISIRCSNVILDGNGHTIDGVDASGSFGILVNSNSGTLTGVTVKNVRLTDWYDGLYFKGVNGGRIESVTAISNIRAGISLRSANDNVLAGCTASGNGQGMYVWSQCSRNRVESCTMSNNNDAGLWLASTGRTTSGIVYDSVGNQVIGNTANGNGRYGLYVDFSEGNTLSDNHAANNGAYQIFLDYSGRSSVDSNTVSGGSEQCIFLYDADDCTITGNTITGASDYGLFVSSTSGLTISRNTISGNGIGGIALNGDASLPANNHILDSNTIRGNGQRGLFLYISSGNVITNNLFTNPTNVVFGGTPGPSTWSGAKQVGTSIVGGSSLGGNFWGSSTGQGFSETTADADGDGICDRPYSLNSANTDLLPLARPGGAVTPTASTTPTPPPVVPTSPAVTPTPVETPVPVPQAPFPSAHVLPTTVEAEHFDAGGQGIAYGDYDAANQGNEQALRPGEGVDLDTSGGLTEVGFVREGEYLEYSVDAPGAGEFVLAVRAANPDASAKAVRVYLDGTTAGQVQVGSTGSWTTFGEFAASAPFTVPQGRHVVTLAFEGVSRLNLDRLTFTAAQPVTTTVAPTPSATVPPFVLPTPTLTPEASPTATPGPELQNVTIPVLPGAAGAPRDLDGDGHYEDVNGNGRADFADVTMLFNHLGDVGGTYPTTVFDYNANGRVDYADVTTLYNRL